MKVLFVCTEGMYRSVTAMEVFKKLAKKKHVKADVKSAGIDNHVKNHITKELIHWADRIYVMEDFHKDWLIDMDKSSEQKITVLGIADVYMKGEPDLIEILEEKLGKEI